MKEQWIEYYYLIQFQYLGFRFHGWQKQTDNYRTVQGMLDRTLNFIFDKKIKFKTMGASRTDAMVSALESYCKLTVKNTELDAAELLQSLNKNLPADIRALSVEKTSSEFKIINNSKSKIYQYFFCNEKKSHPFAAPYMTTFTQELDIDLMIEAANIFEGEHNFSRYCFRPTPEKQYVRIIDEATIKRNTEFTASFFPKNSYVFEVRGVGFLRNQIRLMMGALVLVGSGEMTIEEFKKSLIGEEFKLASFIAPASGLMLKSLNLQASE